MTVVGLGVEEKEWKEEEGEELDKLYCKWAIIQQGQSLSISASVCHCLHDAFALLWFFLFFCYVLFCYCPTLFNLFLLTASPLWSQFVCNDCHFLWSHRALCIRLCFSPFPQELRVGQNPLVQGSALFVYCPFILFSSSPWLCYCSKAVDLDSDSWQASVSGPLKCGLQNPALS